MYIQDIPSDIPPFGTSSEPIEIKAICGCKIYHAENIVYELLKLEYIETLKHDINHILSYMCVIYNDSVVDVISLIYIKYL